MDLHLRKQRLKLIGMLTLKLMRIDLRIGIGTKMRMRMRKRF